MGYRAGLPYRVAGRFNVPSVSCFVHLSSFFLTFVFTGFLSYAPIAQAQAVGDDIINPLNGDTLEVAEVLDGIDRTTDGLFVRTTTSVDDTFTDPDDPANTLTVTTVFTNATTGLLYSFIVDDGREFEA